MTNTPDKSEMKACPFCGDPMARAPGGFGHTSDYQDALPQEKRCILRHTFYPDELTPAWNRRASSRPADQVPDTVERVARAISRSRWEQTAAAKADIPGYVQGDWEWFIPDAKAAIAALQAVPAASSTSNQATSDELCKRVFLGGHTEGWTGNQCRRDALHIDAEKRWELYVQSGALEKARLAASGEVGDSISKSAVLALLHGSVERWRPYGGSEDYIDGYETGAADACLFLADDIRRGPPYPDRPDLKATGEE